MTAIPPQPEPSTAAPSGTSLWAEHGLLVGLLLLSAVGYAWPALGTALAPFVRAVPDPFLASKPALSGIFAVTMFCIGVLLPPEQLRATFAGWAVTFGLLTQYVTMPCLAIVAALVAPLPTEMRLGIVMVGCVPGAMASNVLTLVAGGNVGYSVSLTTAATLFSPLAVPAALSLGVSLLGRSAQVSVSATDAFLVPLLTVVLPVLVGYGVARLTGSWLARWAEPIAKLTILWIIAAVVGLNRDRLAQVPLTLAFWLLVINLLGYLVGYAVAGRLGMAESMRRALAIEVGMQNAGLGVVLSLALFPNQPAVAIAPAAYTFGCMLTGTILAQWWSRRPIPAEP